MNLGLNGRVVLLTGGSSGIGASLAQAYGDEGARVAMTYRTDRVGAERVARRVENAGGEGMIVPFDLASDRGADILVETVCDHWGGIDVLVANAVQWPDRSPAAGFEALGQGAWEVGLRANVEGSFRILQAVIPSMRDREWGRILFLSTGLAEEGMRGAETYTCAKAALVGLVRSLAWDVGRDGILINILAAGLTLTEANRERIPETVRSAMAARTPLERLSYPEELAGPALFLTSAMNSSITGEVIREGSSTGRSSHAQ